MRSVIALAFCLLLPLAARGQEGVVTYDHTVKIAIELPPEMQHLRDRIPSERTVRQQLFFNDAASLMKAAPREAQAEDAGGDRGGMRFRMREARLDNTTYTHFDTEARVEKREFMGRTFRIDAGAEPLAWKLTGEKSEFLGYLAQRAVATRDTVTVEAWFTPQIPVPAGPAGYGGLPGLILVLTVDAGREAFVATDVALGPVEAGLIVPPTDGRTVTRAEFDAIVEEKMKEMGATRGRGRGIVIRQ